MRWVAPQVPWIFSLFLAEIGWTCMVTGYSIVLWSRLSIIIDNRRVIWGILAVVLFDGFVFHTALWVLQYGLSSVKGAARGPWLDVLNPFERVQVTVFTVQECVISAVYMWGVWRLLKDQEHRTKRARHVLWLLFAVQVITISMDLVVCILDLAGYFTLKAIIHSWVYGLSTRQSRQAWVIITDSNAELELEFVVLNQLVDIAKSGVPGLKTITDDSVPDSTVTSNPSEMPSQPDSDRTFVTRPEWLASESSEGTEPKLSSKQIARRMSSPAPLSSIPEANTMSFQEMLRRPHYRTTSESNIEMDSIGVIPEP